MPAKDLPSAFQTVAEQMAPGSQLIRHWPLTGGVSAQIDAFEIELPDKHRQTFVMRRLGDHDWKPTAGDGLTTEYQLHRFLVAKGFPLPRPLLLDTSANHFPTPYFVMEMVDGTTMVQSAQLEHALDQMADFLIQLHGLDTKTITIESLPPKEDPVRGALDYIPDNEEWAKLRTTIAGWQTMPIQDVLLHGDYWPGNVLWHHGNLAAVIDWEDAAIGNPVSDLACARIELMAMYGDSAMEKFTHRYLTGSPIDITDLPLWEVYGGFAALATMGEWGLTQEDEASRRHSTTQLVATASEALISDKD